MLPCWKQVQWYKINNTIYSPETGTVHYFQGILWGFLWRCKTPSYKLLQRGLGIWCLSQSCNKISWIIFVSHFNFWSKAWSHISFVSDSLVKRLFFKFSQDRSFLRFYRYIEDLPLNLSYAIRPKLYRQCLPLLKTLSNDTKLHFMQFLTT